MRGLAPRPRSREAVELGREGEALAAKLRLSAALLAALVPLADLLSGPAESEAWIGVGAGAAIALLGAAVLALGRRPEPPRWLGLASCLLDISILSLVNVAFVLAGNPLAATNSRVVFSCYFVALSLSCLRLDERLCAAAGLAAVLQYGGIVLWAAHRFDLASPRFDHSAYGAFLAGNQVNRLALLAVATAIHVVTVAKLRSFWAAAIHDRLTGLHNREYAESRLAESLSQARRTARPVAVALPVPASGAALTFSAGVAAGPDDGETAADLLRRADERLYAAKQAGRNRVQGCTGAARGASPPYTPASGMT